MTAGWVAAATRGRALLMRTIGADVARSIATAESWPSARDHLRNTVYGTELAGWLPPASSGLVRAFAAPMEIANIEAHVAQLATGATSAPPIPLGTLGVAWSAVATQRSADQVRVVLARSAWGDPGGADRATIALGLHVAWARRLARQAPDAASAALAPTMHAHHRALDAASTHAATRTALARLDAELATTRRRRRAIGDRLVPRLEGDLRVLELELDEQDREEALRVRLASDDHHEVRT